MAFKSVTFVLCIDRGRGETWPRFGIFVLPLPQDQDRSERGSRSRERAKNIRKLEQPITEQVINKSVLLRVKVEVG